jgi:hypothetical protein
MLTCKFTAFSKENNARKAKLPNDSKRLLIKPTDLWTDTVVFRVHRIASRNPFYIFNTMKFSIFS